MQQREVQPVLAEIIMLGVFLVVLFWSYVAAADRMTWWLEAFPALIAVPLLMITFRRFRWSRLAYALILIHACILLVGAHYTYEHVPLFDWIRNRFHLLRNDYDKLGHLAQGFVPAVIAREFLLRKRVLARTGWLFFLVLSICMCISASYELLEWAVAVFQGSSADAFLATQGDPFDTQSDMFCAMIGSIAAQLLLARVQNRILQKQVWS